MQPINRHPIRLIVSVGSLLTWRGVEPHVILFAAVMRLHVHRRSYLLTYAFRSDT
nr:MAG TPA: hypothetical protein [Caudoviricetes sp.]